MYNVSNVHLSILVTQIRRKDGSAVSSIVIGRVSNRQTGTYSCRPANLEPAQVKLHVIRGKVLFLFCVLANNSKIHKYMHIYNIYVVFSAAYY